MRQNAYELLNEMLQKAQSRVTMLETIYESLPPETDKDPEFEEALYKILSALRK